MVYTDYQQDAKPPAVGGRGGSLLVQRPSLLKGMTILEEPVMNDEKVANEARFVCLSVSVCPPLSRAFFQYLKKALEQKRCVLCCK